ncbi:hypothetical protein [Nocardia sp. N2S4-5]|uniref:hypothetical protein n=1 Tax=Nocardia sp. N2S4-5 TaxID=3351565 RepID=UPI0037D80CD1
MTVTWADVSHHQGIPIDNSYPHRLFAFRTNSGDARDTLAVENIRRVLAMLETGRLDAVIAYYFFRPGAANCDLHRDILTGGGLWGHPRLVTMVDVEDAGGAIRGDQSAEVNDEVERLRRWYGNPARVIGYLNAVANAGLWRTRPAGMRFVTPSYSHNPGEWASTPPPQWMQEIAFAQQFTDDGRCAPWSFGVDLNYSPLELPELLALLGITGGTPVSDPITVGAGQLLPTEDRLRQINRPENVNPSTRSPKEPWPYDMWADQWNETVWDGYDFAPEMADMKDDEKRSLIGLVRTIGARQTRLREQLDRIEAKLDQLGGK